MIAYQYSLEDVFIRGIRCIHIINNIKLLMTIDDKIRDEKIEYDINREPAT